MKHEIILESELEQEFPYADLLSRCITAALDEEGVDIACEINVLITDDEGIHQINLEQRGVDRPTDVLSFPMFYFRPGKPPKGDSLDVDPETGLLPLGDMVLSYERASAQAEEYGHSVPLELGYLAVHSVLHLLGYDHMDEGEEKRQMRQREDAIMSVLDLTRERQL